MSRARVLGLLSERLGLDPASLGEAVVEHALTEARRSFGVADDLSLWRRAQAEPDVLVALLDQFLIPETWFFRAAEQFDDLLRFAREQAPSGQRLRVLSLPCATGEEAYSAAIVLLRAGFAAADFEVLGVDIGPAFIDTARRGRYGPSTLRRHHPGPDWLLPDGDAACVAPALHDCVSFQLGNALDSQLLAGSGRFDVIFCRNLLIYLHREARQQLLGNLERLLATPGLLLAGQAEPMVSPALGLQPFGGRSALAYRRLDTGGAPIATHTTAPTRLKSRASSAKRRAPPTAVIESRPGVVESAAPPSLDAARQWADRGETERARTTCLAVLRAAPFDREALFLLAMLEAAADRLDAADAALAKLLFLHHDHLPALQHRAALARRRGDLQAAADFNERVERCRSALRVRP